MTPIPEEPEQALATSALVLRKRKKGSDNIQRGLFFGNFSLPKSVKLAADPRLRSEGEPEIMKQMGYYREFLQTQRSKIWIAI